MSIVNLKEILIEAEKGDYAVGCYNVINYESVRGILDAAEETSSPIILGIAQVQLKDVDFSSIMNILVHECSRAKIPVAIHLDHGLDFGTIKKSIDLGCTSVMYDGSLLPLEENIKITKEIISYAHARNVSVETEVGEMGAENDSADNHQKVNITNVMDAQEFFKQTGVDALAVSFGTVHGITKETPTLNLSLLEELNNKVDTYLVMHGGSGLTAEEYKNVIKRGIRKINYFSYGYQAVANKIRKFIEENPTALYDEISYFSIEAFKEVFGEVMEMFGSAGKVK